MARPGRYDSLKTQLDLKAGKLRGHNAAWCSMRQDFKITPITPSNVRYKISDCHDINQALLTLNDDSIELIGLRHIKKKGDGEISIMLSIDPKCVSKRLTKIYSRLTKELKKGETHKRNRLASV